MAGDLNGDGIGDLFLVDDQDNAGAGAVYVVFGARSSRPVSLSNLGARGVRIDNADVAAGVGDVDGDGTDDLAVGSTYTREIHVIAGGAGLHTASADDPSLRSLRITNVDPSGLQSSSPALTGAGDVDHDGHADVLIGASGYVRCPECNEGRAYLVHGRTMPSTIDVGHDPSRTLVMQGLAGTGSGVASIGDTDGDGRRELAIGGTSTTAIVTDAPTAGTLALNKAGRRGYLIDGECCPSGGLGDISRDLRADFTLQNRILLGRALALPRPRRRADRLPGYFVVAGNSDSPDFVALSGGGRLNRDAIPDLVVRDGLDGGLGRGRVGLVFPGTPTRIAIAPHQASIKRTQTGLRLKLLCPATARRSCAVKIRARSTRHGRPTLGTARLRIASGRLRTADLRVPVNRQRLLTRGASVAITAATAKTTNTRRLKLVR